MLITGLAEKAPQQGEIPKVTYLTPAEELVTVTDRLYHRDTHPLSAVEVSMRAHAREICEKFPDAIKSPNILIAGLGVSGGNVGFELAYSLAEKQNGLSGTWIVIDPDIIDEKNVRYGQPYSEEQVGHRKVDAFASNLIKIHVTCGGNPNEIDIEEYSPEPILGEVSPNVMPTPPKCKILKVPRGLSADELTNISHRYNIELFVDGIDFKEAEAILDSHKAASQLHIPIVTGLDIADTAKVTCIHNRKDDPATYEDVLFSQNDVTNYKKIRAISNQLWRNQLAGIINAGQPIPEHLLTPDIVRILGQKGSVTTTDISKLESPTTLACSYYLVAKHYVNLKDISPLLIAMLNEPALNNGVLSLATTGRAMGAIAAAKSIEEIAQRRGAQLEKTLSDIGTEASSHLSRLNTPNTMEGFTTVLDSGISSHRDYSQNDAKLLVEQLTLAYQESSNFANNYEQSTRRQIVDLLQNRPLHNS